MLRQSQIQHQALLRMLRQSQRQQPALLRMLRQRQSQSHVQAAAAADAAADPE